MIDKALRTLRLKAAPVTAHARYEIWVSRDGSEATLLPVDSPQYDLLTHDTEGRKLKLHKSFLARDWEQAKRNREWCQVRIDM